MVLPILTKEGEEESKVPSIVPPQTLPGMGGPQIGPTTSHPPFQAMCMFGFH